VLNVYCNRPTAAFKIDVDEGVAPLTVTVIDESWNAPPSSTTYKYTFDGIHTSNERVATFTYTEPGVFTINETIRRQCVDPAYSQYSSATRKIWVKAPATVAIVSAYFGNLEYITTTPTPTTTTTTTVTTTTTSAAAVTTIPAMAAITTLTTSPAMPGATTAAASHIPDTAVATSGAQNAPSSPGTGTLSVVTTPAGAQIFIDDVMRGASPATIPDLLAGPHMLRLEQAGYQIMIVPVTISDGKTTEYSTALVPEAGGIGMLPLIAGAVVVIGLVGAGAYFFMKKKKAP